jgi:hypothetical protein
MGCPHRDPPGRDKPAEIALVPSKIASTGAEGLGANGYVCAAEANGP